jgi:acetone carboxylase alpha subunit
LISHKVAGDVYCVAYNPDSLLVDDEATERLREEEREKRKKNGVPYGEFKKQWDKLKPSEEILQFYGDWPETKYDSFSYFGDWDKER